MQQASAIAVLEALASSLRLAIFRELVRRGSQGLVAGEISATLDIPPTNLSFHLKSLTHAGLLTVKQEGRFQRYRANMPLMLDLVAYLTEECCAGDADQCEALRGASGVAPGILPPLRRPRAEAGP
jgi:ArsR family transcriptional regulator, arsenate/arsenite/antimonite-responsive transcriptional repressor